MDYVWIIEINCFCILILGIILYSLCKNYDRQTKQRYYIKALLAGIIAFAMDINWSLIELGILPLPGIVNYITNAIYEILTIVMGYYWFCYVEIALESKLVKNKLCKILAHTPILIITVCVIISYFTGFMFSVDENGIYQRGPYIVIHIALCHLYTVITTIHAFIKSLKIKSYMKAKEYRVLAMFLLFPLSIGIIQILVPNIPSISVGVTLAFLFVYIDLQNLMISVDTLSGLNNRNQMIRYLGARMKTEAGINKLYVFMLDVNKFKKINDTYGHIEGDQALIRCANALKAANKSNNNFIGRYGGDEFIIISDLPNDKAADELCEKITALLQDICKTESVPYDLSFSYGYTSYNKEMKTIQDLISKADEMLYEAKKRRNSQQ